MSSITDILQYILSGITIGAIYAMVGLGFTMVYNATSIINFAQGEFVMLGGMLGVTFVGALKSAGLPTYMAILLAFLLAVGTTTLVGIIMEKVAIEPITHLTGFHYAAITATVLWLCRAVAGWPLVISAPVAVGVALGAYALLRNKVIESMKNPTVMQLVIITIALSIVIRGIVMFTFGKDPYFMDHFLPEKSISLFGAAIVPQTLLVLGVIIIVVIMVGLFFGFTMTGKAMQACAFNRDIAKLMGINDRSMILLSFAMSALVGAVAGYVVTPITLMDYDRGPMLALKGFGAAVLGGLGNGYGAVVAGFILGILEALGTGLISSGYKDAISLIILLAVLFYRPSGLFGSAEAARFKDF
ncbi:MAG: branched-chain amino acid ABC transporter permease [Deltaproteobacteria bacterium]|nr:branched-chain amino acid ABC transporter permease [Deltaproteobacteria bacterium]